ncbi:glycan metabolism protein RagB [Butyricimonas faecihominis]|jgi:ragB/susD domain protein|nr:RagB/SusD family nutrient uptake outer membrane protein [Butyricimonas faecihominis]WOF07208.1 RagB/SusD family nutrient uptake outer membrane protein [Butyricimonas faecihominis]BEI56778.1 RagB/SusD family nutrient uptake outer membrane protein [Butyricimonas faecihominis]GGJ44892.1 glycan metabolism protein RagB [Butyricimonas faecihominis]
MKKMKRYLILILCVLLFNSCGKFLEEFSQDLAYAESCADLDEILIGNGYMEQPEGFAKASIYGNGYYPYIHVMDDDVIMTVFKKDGVTDLINEMVPYKNFYDWSDQLTINPKTDEEWEDKDWEKMYSHIAYLNVIIAHVKKFSHDSVETRNRVEGEARFLRGAYYYLLTNLYANPYVKESASSDMGVPLNLTEDIVDEYYKRNSMEECYRVIVEDLKVAADKLKGVTQPTIYRVNELAARILLSRVYLYMGEWQLALDECQKALALEGVELMDLKSFQGREKERYVLDNKNPEIVFTQGYSATNTFYDQMSYFCICTFGGSEDLISLYNRFEEQQIKDLRLDAFFEVIGDEQYKMSKVGEKVYDCFVIRSAELYLNKAEAEAMLDKAEAIQTIKTLLNNRFEGGIPDIDGLSGKDLVSFIRDERRRELCFEAHRWFDLRRYAVSPKYPEKKSIRHTAYDIKGKLEGDYVLKPYGEDPAWVLPIPGYEIVYNQGNLVDNPQRVERELE